MNPCLFSVFLFFSCCCSVFFHHFYLQLLAFATDFSPSSGQRSQDFARAIEDKQAETVGFEADDFGKGEDHFWQSLCINSLECLESPTWGLHVAPLQELESTLNLGSLGVPRSWLPYLARQVAQQDAERQKFVVEKARRRVADVELFGAFDLAVDMVVICSNCL